MKRKSLLNIRIILYILISPLILMWLWNYIMPIVGLVEINYFQAFAMKMLCGILFKSNFSVIDDFKEINQIEKEEKGIN